MYTIRILIHIIFCIIAYILTEHDMIWIYVVLGLGFVIIMDLHMRVRDI